MTIHYYCSREISRVQEVGFQKPQSKINSNPQEFIKETCQSAPLNTNLKFYLKQTGQIQVIYKTEKEVNVPQLFRLQEGACLARLPQQCPRHPCPSLQEPGASPNLPEPCGPGSCMGKEDAVSLTPPAPRLLPQKQPSNTM